MPALKVRIAHEDRPALPAGILTKSAKAMLADLLATLDRCPAPMILADSTTSESITLWMSDDQFATLESLARQHGLDGPGVAATSLLRGAARATLDEVEAAKPKAPITTTLDRINVGFGHSTRDDQGRYFLQMRAAVLSGNAHRVVFAEAATGTGKTRAFESAVLDWCAAHPEARAAIAAPTYGVLLQAINAWRRIATVTDTPEFVVIVGQSEFVSRNALMRVLEEHPDLPGADAARDWMARGAPPGEDDAFGHPWLMRGLIEATAGAWTLQGQVQIDTDVDEDDPGMLAYTGQFREAGRARVIFCTHAMLAVEARRRIARATSAFAKESDRPVAEAAWSAWLALDDQERQHSRSYQVRNDLLRQYCEGDVGRLPDIGLLVVDEAHLLEQAFASVFASGVSIARLMRALRLLREASASSVRVQDMRRMDEAWETLRRVGALTGAERVSAADNAAIAEAVALVRGVVIDVLSRAPAKSINRPEIRQLRAIRLALDVAEQASGERSGMSVRVSWSPTVQWPSIEVGRYDVSRELDFLCNVIVEDATVMVSATLFDDVSAAGMESMRRMLSVRSALLIALTPIRPAWLYDPVTLHLVGEAVHADGLPRFRRPVKRDKLPTDEFERRVHRWRDDVATYIERAHLSGAGGMLVLLTAHTERAEIAERLQGRDIGGPLLVQTPEISLDKIRREYLMAISRGERPCLLAVGAAWTGLDLSADALDAMLGMGLSTSDDNVLTDLVIPTAPIGTNRSLTHEWRRETTGMLAEIGATSIMFRQGLGRLVRRMGLKPNRRIHFLDSRIHDPAWRALFAPVFRALSPYTKRKTV